MNLSISESTYRTIRNKIVSFEFVPREKLSEERVSELLQTSRTPVREAFIKLSEEGLIDIIPQKGSIVSPIKLDGIEEARIVRRLVEHEVIKRVMLHHYDRVVEDCGEVIQEHKKADIEDYKQQFYFDSLFHYQMYKAADMLRTWNMLEKMNIDYTRIRYLSLVDLKKNSMILSDHELIYQKLCEKDLDGAIYAVNTHLDSWYQEKELILSHFQDYFQ